MNNTERFKPPRLSGNLLQRERLSKAFDRAGRQQGRLYICAPGGSGKTVAVLSWLAGMEAKVAWLSVDGYMREPARLYHSILTALYSLQKKNQTLQTFLQNNPQPGFTFDTLVSGLQLLQEADQPYYIVLDDIQKVESPELDRTLPLFFKYLPLNYIPVFISRISPPETVSEMVEKKQIAVFTARDLKFTPEEVWALFVQNRESIDRQVLKDVLEDTGGWAIGVNASLMGLGRLRPRAGADFFTSYLDTQVWPGWEEEMQDFLLRISLPMEITPALARRLTHRQNNEKYLQQLLEGNAFITQTGKNSYRLHDLFRDYLRDKLERTLPPREVEGLKEQIALWNYEQGNYYIAMDYYLDLQDHQGIIRCGLKLMDYASNFSVEGHVEFVRSNIDGRVPESFIKQNIYLLATCSWYSLLTGDSARFEVYMDALYQKMPRLREEHPEMVENVLFQNAVDYRRPLLEIMRGITQMDLEQLEDGKVSSVTQNLPYLHRSIRDFSEFAGLEPADLEMAGSTFGKLIGQDYPVLEDCLKGGLYLEQYQMQKACYHALSAQEHLQEDSALETWFCVKVLLLTSLIGIGAHREAREVLRSIDTMITEHNAYFLSANFEAVSVRVWMLTGHTGEAERWLENRPQAGQPLSVYQIYQHITTLRCYVALEQNERAVDFAGRINELAERLNRPLDRLEATVLLSIARHQKGEDGTESLKEALEIARPYGYVWQFVREAARLLPVISRWMAGAGREDAFARRVYREICKNLEIRPDQQVHLTRRQQVMLDYLAGGYGYNDIAQALGLKRSTIKTHVRSLYKALTVSSAEEAVEKARMLGLLKLCNEGCEIDS